MSQYWRSIRALKRDVLLYLITPALIGLTVFGGIYSVLFNLYLVRLGYGAEFVGQVNAISQFGLALFALPASTIGLRLGTRRSMILGLGLAVVGYAPFRYPLLIAAGLLLIGVIVLWMTAEPPVLKTAAPVAGSPRRVAPLGIIAMIMLVGILRGSGEGAARTFFNVYMDIELGVSATRIGLFLALGQLASTPAALLSPLLAARWGNGRSIIAGTAMAAATTMSIGNSWALMSVGGGYVITLFGYRSLFLAGALSSALGALLFWGYFRIPRGEFAQRVDVGV